MCFSGRDVAVVLLQRNADAGYAEAGRRAMTSVRPPRTTALELEQTYDSFTFNKKCYSGLYRTPNNLLSCCTQ